MAIDRVAGSFFQASSVGVGTALHRSNKLRRVRESRISCSSSSSGNYSGQEARQAADLVSRPKEDKLPRLCTLRAFSQAGGDAVTAPNALDAGSLSSSSVFFKQLAASVQATAQAQDFETLSGRLAMVAFAVALGVEVATGNNVFKGIEVKELGQTVALSAVCVTCMAAFTAAWGAKNRIGHDMTKGCQDLVEFILTDTIDAMFYEDDDS